MSDKRLLPTLVQRGTICITDGRLEIIPDSGKEVPGTWLRENKEKVIYEILELLRLDAYQYLGYSIGRYGEGRYQGVTLQFMNTKTSEGIYAIFNAELNRKRGTGKAKKGQPLPAGQFRAGKRTAFYQFWQRTSLPFPYRDRFYSCMGKLKPLLFSLQTDDKGKAITSTIKPLDIPSETIRKALNYPHKESTIHAQLTHKESTIVTHKETPQSHTPQCVQPISGTCENNYGYKLISKAVTSNPYTPITVPKRVEEQSNDEWLSSYDNYQPTLTRFD